MALAEEAQIGRESSRVFLRHNTLRLGKLLKISGHSTPPHPLRRPLFLQTLPLLRPLLKILTIANLPQVPLRRLHLPQIRLKTILDRIIEGRPPEAFRLSITVSHHASSQPISH